MFYDHLELSLGLRFSLADNCITVVFVPVGLLHKLADGSEDLPSLIEVQSLAKKNVQVIFEPKCFKVFFGCFNLVPEVGNQVIVSLRCRFQPFLKLVSATDKPTFDTLEGFQKGLVFFCWDFAYGLTQRTQINLMPLQCVINLYRAVL